MFTLDTSTSFGARIDKQLEAELVVWLTTVGRTGTPAPNPVWFHWTGEQFLIFSLPAQAKVRNIAANPRVALNFNATFTGGDVGVITGDAVIDHRGANDAELAAYDAKYAEGLAGLNLTAADFHRDYSVLIRVTPEKLRGF